jgi:hypothetical protein
MTEISFDEAWRALLVAGLLILTVAGAIVTIGKAIDTIKCWKGTKSKNMCLKLDDHEARLKAGSERFVRQDMMIHALQEGQRVTCVGMQALLESAVYGNNNQGIKDAHEELKTYLTGNVGVK